MGVLNIEEYSCDSCGREMDVYRWSKDGSEMALLTCETGRLGSQFVDRPKSCCGQPFRFHLYGRPSKSARAAQLSGSDKPVVWYHPKLGPRFPGRNDADMPKWYKDRGFERKEFNSYYEHKAFCDREGLINHRAEGITNSRHEGGARNRHD